MMNKERLLILADHIEACEHIDILELDNPNDTSFQMSQYEFSCGAPACIGGHACVLFSDDSFVPSHSNLFYEAQHLLNLSLEDASVLFEPFDNFGYAERRNLMSKISPQLAASVIRDFVKTGKVSWPLPEDIIKYVTI